MPTILLFDTETNGLPKNRSAPPSEFHLYPAILQLSWTIVDWDPVAKRTTTIEHRDFAPPLAPEIVWDAGAERIHKIRESDARAGDGNSTESMLIAFTEALQTVDCIAAHNLSFDKAVVQAAGFREKLPPVWPTKPTLNIEDITNFEQQNRVKFKIQLCTMSYMRNIMKLPGSAKQIQYTQLSPYKSPRLSELYTWLFETAFIGGEHSSKSDVKCLEECVTEMLVRGIVVFSVPS